MADSLLAHLYTRIRGSKEDIATLSLHYLLSQSKALNSAFTKLISDALNLSLGDTLQYNCQQTEEDKRPDMTGKNKSGQNIVFCEMKFYAGLTPNQPLGYIDLLKKEEGQGLVFICPKARKTLLWSKLCEICSARSVADVKKNCISIDGIHMSILTWSDIIDELERTASHSDKNCLPDIFQLKGFCSQMDSDAFIPFTPQDITADNAKRIQRYYQVIDETVNLLLADNTTYTVAGRKVPYFLGNSNIGYERKIFTGQFIVSIVYDHALWKSTSCIETPFWVSIRDKNDEQGEDILPFFDQIEESKKDNTAWNIFYLALEPLTDATLDEICKDLMRQIYEYLNFFNKA